MSPTPSKTPDLPKFCVFCGSAPREKTKEHVVPEWLIRLTGDPNREVNITVEFASPPNVKKFAFDQFTLPACNDCNGEFSRLEAQAEPVMRKILNNESLHDREWDVLLSWFDKVRVGLWLSKYVLNKNSFGIKPKFQIAQRRDIRDRALIIFRRASTLETLTFFGTFLPSFDFSPTSFALVVNGYMFVNLTSHDLCSHRLGFPSTQPVGIDGERMIAERRPATNRIISPVLRNFPHAHGTGIYQPIYCDLLRNEEGRNSILDEYVTENSLEPERGIGAVFLQQQGRATRYPKEKSSAWIPSTELNNSALFQIAHRCVYGHQIAEMQGMLQICPPEQRRFWRDQISGCRKVLNALLKRIDTRAI